jgi:hypothetical protein
MEVVENAGLVIAEVLQPSMVRVTGQVVITGLVLSTTLTTCVQMIALHPEQVSELRTVYVPQTVPELTVTVAPFDAPTIKALLVLLIMDQL